MTPFPKNGLALAPMRALTQPPFWRILNRYGAPSAYFSEFFRVHENFCIDRNDIESALKAAGTCPIWIQLMGNDPQALTQNIRILETYPIAGIDFNVGCPVPKIFKKQAGGGLLRDLPLLRRLLLELRSTCTKPLSVKFRIGFDSGKYFDEILAILTEAQPDLATLHARTVTDLYRGKPRYEYVKIAAETLPFPLLANGNIETLQDIENILLTTGCYGIMLGRAAIRNPWIFQQWNELKSNKPITYPTFTDVYHYLEDLFFEFGWDKRDELTALGCLKRFANYIGPAIDKDGAFLHQIRTVTSLKSFWGICSAFLQRNGTLPYYGKPFTHLHAQPNKE